MSAIGIGISPVFGNNAIAGDTPAPPAEIYLLWDEFTTDRAAGAVNGTLAEPGGVGTLDQLTRVVVDTNSKLSLSSGLATYATGGVAGGGNPGLWYGSHARALGRVFIARININTSGSSQSEVGWDANQSTRVDTGIATSALTIVPRINGATGPTIGTFAQITNYDQAVILRASGVYLFIKGGIYEKWSLLWSSTAGSTTPLYPVAAAISATSVFTADHILVPDSLYIPTPLAYDTFTRANGALGSSETTGPDSQAVTARAWTDQLGTWAISSNVAAASALSGGAAIATAPCASADVVADVAVTRTSGSAGLILRYADANNYLRATIDGTNCLIEQVVAGTPTTLRTGAVSYGAGRVIRVVLDGTTGRLFYNDLAVGAAFTVPASSATAHGLYTTDTGNSLDGFLVMARGTGDEYAGLDAFTIGGPVNAWDLLVGREDHSGVYAPTQSKFYVFGGDTDSAALSEIRSVRLSDGLVTTLAATLPTGRFKAPAVFDSQNGMVYIYGGRNSYIATAYATIVRFDPATEEATTLTEELPSSSAEFGAAYDSTQGVSYLFGGYTGNNSDTLLTRILKHNPGAETVTTLAETLPVALASMAAAYVPGEQAIYLFGGFRNDTFSPRTVDTIYKFDCATETLSLLAETLPLIRDSAQAVYSAAQNKIYIIGGYDGAGGPGNYYASILAFDVATETIATLTSTMIKATDDFAAALVGGAIYLMGVLPAGATDNEVIRQRYFGKFTLPDNGVVQL